MYSVAPHQLMMIVINCIAFFLGVPGNILVLRVYFSKTRKTSTHIMIMGLALSDLISLFFTFPLEIISWINEYRMDDGQAFCRLVSFCFHYFAQCSVLITVAIAIDRYNAVCRPHQWKITTGRAQGVVATCLLLSTLTSFAAIFSYKVKNVEVLASSVYFESDDPNNNVNITLCDRDLDGGFNKAVFILHTIWFVTLFVVLMVAYLKIYLTIRKRVSAGVGAQEEGDPSHMRVVRPVIRFISHLTVITNRAGSTETHSSQAHQHGDTDNNNPIDGATVDHDPATHSTDDPAPNSPVKPPGEETNPSWIRDENPSLLRGESARAVTRALLLAGGMSNHPVLPSIGQAKDMEHKEPELPKEDDSSPPKPRASRRQSTAWNKIKSIQSIVEKEVGTPQGEAAREGFKLPPSSSDIPENEKRAIIRTPIAKVMHKRAAATAMNLKIQKTTTNMLLVAALTAVLTWFPTLVIEVSKPKVHEWLIDQSDWLQVLTCLMGWLFLFNFVTNPFVYSLMNSRFREDCGKSFLKYKFSPQKSTTVQNEK